MTEQDLLSWALEHYFSVIPWAVDQAKVILDEKGMDAAVEHLRKILVDGCMGFCGPGQPRFDTGSGKVRVWQSDSKWVGEPDLEVDIVKFCRWKLESLYQLKLL